MKKAILGLCSLAAVLMVPVSSVSAADKTTKYRVYQNDQLLMEFANYASAESYARMWKHGHVEEIGTRKWLWDNYPRYRIYQNGNSLSEWEFADLNSAITEAKRWGHAAIRDLQSGGWIWNNYPKYRVYQGDYSASSWEFMNLQDAIAEARRWSGAHITELNTGSWIWDNLTPDMKEAARNQVKTYQVYQGEITSDAWRFAYLEDAINESRKWGNSIVKNTTTNAIIQSNLKQYQVYQNSNLLDSFLSIDDAVSYAKLWAHAKIVQDGRAIWTNFPYYEVRQSGKKFEEANTISGALSIAKLYSNASIVTLDGNSIWNNFRKLMFWGWNGSSDPKTISTHAAGTLGLDVDSPTFFSLADKDGNMTDTSNKEVVDSLKRSGISVHPLVHNQFDAALTSQFLANPTAQTKFIQSLVSRTAAIGADGINIDFESLAAKDRAAFTAFVRNLTDAAHRSGLTVSIDLPRGSIKWNAQTAFDHEALAGIVDYIMTMAYDQYWKGSTEPGSVSGLQWAEEGVNEFLSYGIPRDKLILGIPFYVREWQIDSSGALMSNRAVLLKDVNTLIATKKATITWDARFNQYKAEYQENGYRYVFWVENEDTVKARLDIAKKYELGGVAAWRLGYDYKALWEMMLQQK